MQLIAKYRNAILLSVLAAIGVYAVLLFVSDYAKLSAALRGFDWKLVPVLLSLSLFNYGLRFIKWHLYLGLVGVINLEWIDSLLIFLSGFSVTLTPAKAGEWLKSFLVRERSGTPIAVTAPIILAERLTDGLAILLLASSGLVLFDHPLARAFLALVVLVAAVAIVLVQNRNLAQLVGRRLARIPALASRLAPLREFYSSSYELLRVRNLAMAISLGLVSWSGECLALALIVSGLGVPFSAQLVILSAFALGFGTLAGSVLLTPGGIGVAEGSIDGLLLTFGQSPWLPSGGVSQPIAAAATLVIRFATLWFGVTLGFIALFLFQRQMGRKGTLGSLPAREGSGADLDWKQELPEEGRH